MLRAFVVDRRPGIFHVTNQGAVSWFEFARACSPRPATTRPRRADQHRRSAIRPAPAPRPANSVLDNLALRLSGSELLPDFRDSLDRLVRDLLA